MAGRNVGAFASRSARIAVLLVAFVGALPISAAAADALQFIMALNEGPEAVQRLLDEGLDPNEPIAGAGPPLIIALSQEKTEIARLLVKSGADVNVVSPPMNLSPLAIAIINGNADTVAMLMDLGANPLQPQPGLDDQTPVSIARMAGDIRIAALLENTDTATAAADKAEAVPDTRRAAWQVAHEADEYSPIVTGAGVAVTSAHNAFVARALADGTKRWQLDLDLTSSHGNPGEILRIHGSTAYFAGGHNDAQLYAVDARNGRLRWKFYTGGEVWAPPVESGDAVYAASLYLGGTDASERGVYVWNIDKASGQERARTFLPSDSTILSAPAVAFGRVFVAVKNVLYAIDANDGRIHWQFRENRASYFQEAFGDLLLSGDEDHAIIAVTARTKDGRAMYLLEARAGTLRAKVVGPDWAHNATLADRFVYTTRSGQDPAAGTGLPTPQTVLVALDAESGGQQWQFGIAQRGRPSSAAPIVSGNRVYYWSSQNFLYALDRKSGEQLWRFDGGRFDDQGKVGVLAAGEVLYLWTTAWLSAVDAASGQAIWGQPIELFSDGAVVLADDLLLFKSRAGEMVAVAVGNQPESAQ